MRSGRQHGCEASDCSRLRRRGRGRIPPAANHGYERQGKSLPRLADASGEEFYPQAVNDLAGNCR